MLLLVNISMIMAKKRRLKIKLTKKNRKKLASIAIPLLIGLSGLVIGIVATNFIIGRSNPKNLVWAADKDVKIPKDLRGYLAAKNECKSYRGTDTPDGVGLWGVYQVSKKQYAKIAYGCSWSITSYIMAVKQDGEWQLLPPAEYFAPFKNGVDPSQGALPYCSIVDKYNVPGEIEPFCINEDGSASDNQRK